MPKPFATVVFSQGHDADTPADSIRDKHKQLYAHICMCMYRTTHWHIECLPSQC